MGTLAVPRTNEDRYLKNRAGLRTLISNIVAGLSDASAADRGQYREAAGAFAQAVPANGSPSADAHKKFAKPLWKSRRKK
jgi:hypothetical protein